MPRPRTAPSSRRPLLGLALATALAQAALATPLVTKRATDEGGYYNPTSNGGRWLTLAANTYPEGLGEPINVVVSADSDAVLLSPDGFYDWSLSLNFGSYLLDSQQQGRYAGECLGQTDGERQAANLGDGSGLVNQTELYRENFGDVTYGTCKESADGGFHYRIWRQNGTQADSGAWFLAASEEEDLSQGHMIVPNGYDLGRDEVVRRALVAGGSTSPVTNRTYEATARNASGPGYFANVTTSDINHGIATDGVVAVLTVRVTNDPLAASAKGTSAAPRVLSAPSPLALAQVAMLGLASLLALSLLA
ncbi:hypothetical protein JCM10450v2_004132 [Rhodotorula kratochvilovae]